ncbi:hypothetical protein BU17DRAFT_64523 [Hysterangium stoloniferum]|nr:hypothetical protein BU17DRAFT_64523 [Hysterangium stoloniferum]
MSLDFLLTYVQARGRAEPINLMLIDARVNYYDERIPIDEWQTRKDEGKYGPVYGQPFHGLPTLEVQTLMGPFKLAGTYAILDYLDDAFDVHEGRDMLQKGKINMIRDVTMSFLLDLHELLKNETWDDPIERIGVHKSRIMPFLLDLSRHISMNGLRKAFGADPSTPLTAAGACAFEALELIELFFPSTLAEWPILATLRQRIASRPQIQTYLESSRRCQRITMSPFETPERIANYATRPLNVPRRAATPTDNVKVVSDAEDPPFKRKKKGRQTPPRPNTVAGDSNEKGFSKTAGWVDSRSVESDTKPRQFFSMVDASMPPADGTFSDSEPVRPRKKSISLFFKRNSKRKTKLEKDGSGKDSEGTPPSLLGVQRLSGDKDIRSLRSVRSETTIDIRGPLSQDIEPPLPSAARGLSHRRPRNPTLLSDSDYSDDDSDIPDEIKPRAL